MSERPGLARCESGVRADGDAPWSGGGGGGKAVRQLDLAALAENRLHDRADAGSALLGMQRGALLSRARPARPVPRDLEVLQILVGRFGELVARMPEQLY